MPITKDPVTGLFWDEEITTRLISWAESDILQEGLNIIEKSIAIKVEWDKYVDKVTECQALGFEPGLPIEKLIGTFAESSRDAFKDKIGDK